ncbi:MAG: hypothetical protein PHI18_00890 [bacterium]|nr:hypothetical protein [bacterium]
MKFLVKVRVNRMMLMEFGSKLQGGELDRSCIRGEAYCVKGDPTVGYSIWEVESREQFEEKFSPWRRYYSDVEMIEVVSPTEAVALILAGH